MERFLLVVYILLSYESDLYNLFSSASFGLNPAGTSDSSASAFPLFSLSRTLYMTLLGSEIILVVL